MKEPEKLCSKMVLAIVCISVRGHLCLLKDVLQLPSNTQKILSISSHPCLILLSSLSVLGELIELMAKKTLDSFMRPERDG